MSAPDELVVSGGRPLRGTVRMPGDKGISHRALIFGALKTLFEWLDSTDTDSKEVFVDDEEYSL